jgi:hypothetical protein
VADLPRRSLILDGELVAFDEGDRPDFHLLRSKRPAVVAWLFDLLSNDGTSLRRQPWFERRRRLERVMARNESPLLQPHDVSDDGEALLRACTEQGLEGIVSKLRSAPYISGPTDAWIKCKVLERGEPGSISSRLGCFARRAQARHRHQGEGNCEVEQCFLSVLSFPHVTRIAFEAYFPAIMYSQPHAKADGLLDVQLFADLIGVLTDGERDGPATGLGYRFEKLLSNSYVPFAGVAPGFQCLIHQFLKRCHDLFSRHTSSVLFPH